MQILEEINGNEWNTAFSKETQQQAIRAIENNKIVLLPELSFQLLAQEKKFFSTAYSTGISKNINFNPNTDVLRGTKCKGEAAFDLKKMLRRYSEQASTLIQALLPRYDQAIQLGRTSFRPIEIEGRIPKSYRKDDARLHVDAFPMTPTQGKRIFRIFTNINPEGQYRVWRTGEPFAEVAKRFLPTVKKSLYGRSAFLYAIGLTKSYCTEYDYIMLQIHNNMKGDLHYQQTAQYQEIRFAPNTTWIVQTDSVSHAALSGQFALEQTFYLPVEAMADPQLSPLRVLEKIANKRLVSNL